MYNFRHQVQGMLEKQLKTSQSRQDKHMEPAGSQRHWELIHIFHSKPFQGFIVLVWNITSVLSLYIFPTPHNSLSADMVHLTQERKGKQKKNPVSPGELL